MGVLGRRQFLVDFWEVGRGDCSVIHLPNGSLIVIDVGPIGSPVVDWLSRQPHRKLESIILTHNDADHAGALTSVIKTCFGRIGSVHVMADRHVKDPAFRQLYRAVDEAYRSGGIQELKRLEAPQTLWSDRKTGLTLEVRHPTMSANVLSSSPNVTSAVIVLSSKGGDPIVWAGDTSIANVASVTADEAPNHMLGPHHGAPIDRRQKRFPKKLAAIAPKAIIASVGTGNTYRHPAVSYIKHVRRMGADFYCTQLTRTCQKESKLRHVCKGAALLGLPQALSGFSCRGTIRLVFDGKDFVPDALAVSQHAVGIQKLSRPKCLRYTPREPASRREAGLKA